MDLEDYVRSIGDKLGAALDDVTTDAFEHLHRIGYEGIMLMDTPLEDLPKGIFWDRRIVAGEDRTLVGSITARWADEEEDSVSIEAVLADDGPNS